MTRTKDTTTLAALAAVATLTLAGAAPAQDLVHKAPAQDHAIYLVGGTVHTATGEVIESGLVGFEGGVITYVGNADALASMSLPEGTEMIDVSGRHVFPGMIATVTNLGLHEISAVPQSRDENETGSFTPEVYAASAVNPDTTLIPVTRSNGILTCGTFPTGGWIPGRFSILRADGWTNDDMAIDPHAGITMNWPSVGEGYSAFGSRRGRGGNGDAQVDEIDAYFDTVEAYRARRSADPSHPVDIGLEAMLDVMPSAGEDQEPVFISAGGYDEIVSAVTWAVGRGLRPVIVGGRDAHLAAELLTTHDVPVVLSGTYAFPKREDSAHDEMYRMPITLSELGVRYAINCSDENAHTRNLPYDPGRSVAYGLDLESALRSVTLWPAQILGIGDTHGSLETGKAATLVVADGHLLEVTTMVELAFVDGKRISLENKQTELRDKYREKYRQLGIIED
ncbi:MAG: amidohydrolase family protein [Phycisphaerales bacterium JB040]